ncbi:MAG: prolipoprotein diacylglyceryl transferase [Calditrichaeota bacterium]|nr:prolipoprotein diacylglyceryl transferase [Calditrichota bacterium]
MHPILYDFGRFKLHSYGLMVFLAFAFGVWLAVRRGRQIGILDEFVIDMSVWILVSAIVGARIAYVLFHLGEFRGRWLDIISPFQSDGTVGIAGLVVLGGVVLTIPVMWWYFKRHEYSALETLDMLIPSLAFGIAIGRVGCFLNGCCHGLPTESSCGVVFPLSSNAGHVFPGQHIHPTQLYEFTYAVIIGIILLLRSPRKRYEGELFYLFFLLYGPFRFFNETMRYYRSGMILFQVGEFSFTVSMFFSVAMIIGGATMLISGYIQAGGLSESG